MKRGITIISAWKIARSYWSSQEKTTAWGLLLIVVGLNFGVVYITVLVNYWHGSFYQVIQDYNYQGFMEVIWRYIFLAALLVIMRGYQIYTRMLLHVRWRRWLTEKYLSDWLRTKTYYRLQLTGSDKADNPDQRISEDIDQFVSLTLRLSIDLLQDLATIISFIIILWNLSGIIYVSIGKITIPIYGYLVWAAMAFSVVGTIWTFVIGKPLVWLDYNQQRYEADFRYSLVRMRENAESIAFYNGEEFENKNFAQCFQYIITNFVRIAALRKKITWLTASYNQASIVFGVFVASPRYFSNQIFLGQMFQVIDAYNHVQNGFSFAMDNFSRLAQWRAVVNRLNNFLICMELSRSKRSTVRRKSEGNDLFSVENLSVFRPDGYLLIENMTFKLKQGERLLITGPSGCGKSTLLRTFSGLWPYADGCISNPGGSCTMFIPQKSYMPLSRLRDVLSYPSVLRESGNDNKIKELMPQCKLAHLVDRLDETFDWGQALSLGEQQRVAFMRALLLKPDWLFLDEATSALDEATERILYNLVKRLLAHTTIISIGHRTSLNEYHTSNLKLDGNGHWQLAVSKASK